MSIVDGMRAVPFLARASEAALARLADLAVLRRYERGEFLFHAGEPVERLFVLLSGRVAATVTSREGTRLLFHVAEAGETPGHVDLLDSPGYLSSAQALTGVTAAAIPVPACVELLAAEPRVALDYARDLSRIIRVLNESMADLVFLDLERRLARTLGDAPASDDVVSMVMTQSELAARLGAARQSLNQALGRLADRGLIRVESPRIIRIVDREALRAFVDGTHRVAVDGALADGQAI